MGLASSLPDQWSWSNMKEMFYYMTQQWNIVVIVIDVAITVIIIVVIIIIH